MEKNEVIEVLALARVGTSTEGRLYESLEHAIKCVELMPELLKIIQQCDPSIRAMDGIDRCRFCKTEWDGHGVNCAYENIIKKAKELIK